MPTVSEGLMYWWQTIRQTTSGMKLPSHCVGRGLTTSKQEAWKSTIAIDTHVYTKAVIIERESLTVTCDISLLHSALCKFTFYLLHFFPCLLNRKKTRFLTEPGCGDVMPDCHIAICSAELRRFAKITFSSSMASPTSISAGVAKMTIFLSGNKQFSNLINWLMMPTVAIASECADVKNYKWRLNPVWHRMLYSCTNMATVGVKGLINHCLFFRNFFRTFRCQKLKFNFFNGIRQICDFSEVIWYCNHPANLTIENFKWRSFLRTMKPSRFSRSKQKTQN